MRHPMQDLNGDPGYSRLHLTWRLHRLISEAQAIYLGLLLKGVDEITH